MNGLRRYHTQSKTLICARLSTRLQASQLGKQTLPDRGDTHCIGYTDSLSSSPATRRNYRVPNREEECKRVCEAPCGERSRLGHPSLESQRHRGRFHFKSPNTRLTRNATSLIVNPSDNHQDRVRKSSNRRRTPSGLCWLNPCTLSRRSSRYTGACSNRLSEILGHP